MFLLLLVPISLEFAVPLSELVAIFATTLWLRAFGGVAGGWLADRSGRKGVLAVALVWMGVCNIGAAMAPTVAAFLLFRAALGIGMGAVWTAGTVLAMEAAPAGSRGSLGGLLQGAYGMGFLLASGAYHLFFDSVGWRGLLLLAAAPSVMSVFIWLFVEESAVWRTYRQPGARLFGPGSFANIATACWWLASTSIVNISVTSLFATHMQRDLGASSALLATPIMMATIGTLVGGVFWGWMSDRVGRRQGLVVPAIIAIAVAPTYLLSQNVDWAIFGYVAQSLFTGGLLGIVPSYLTERFGATIRATASGFIFHLGVVLGGVVPPILMYTHTDMGIDLGVAMLIGTVVGCVSLCIAVLAGPETRSAMTGSDPIYR
jgi:SHS family lactate transporter-like MFS transporter